MRLLANEVNFNSVHRKPPQVSFWWKHCHLRLIAPEIVQNRLVQNPLDPNVLQASIQGPFSFTHILFVGFYASFCFQVPKPMSCVLDFCYRSTLYLIPHSVPVIFCYITSHYETSWLNTTMWAVLGGDSWSLFPAVSAEVA